jgi:hypothetical protein
LLLKNNSFGPRSKYRKKSARCCSQSYIQYIHTYIYYSAHSLIRVFQWLFTLEQTKVDCELTKVKQPLLVHTSLMICSLTYVPNPSCQLSLWELESRSTRRKPTTFRLTFLLFSHEDRVRVALRKFSLMLEPATSEVKGKCAS